MRIFSFYRDFFKFLDKISTHTDKWEAYYKYYFRLHKEFLESFFSHFPLVDSLSLKQRVEAIKKGDYGRLISLISICPPERIIEESFKECVKFFSSTKEPDVYLFIGFFSPDGFVMDFQGKPAIGFGLERFKDFSLFRILFAHEYAHYLLNLGRGEVPRRKKLKWLLISEGLATYFSSVIFPGHTLSDHFLFSRDKLNWCQENESLLRDIYGSAGFSSEELIDFYFKGNPGLNLPPRAAKYLGFLAVKRFLVKDEKGVSWLFSNKTKALSLKL
jgi:hypothetical protein